MKSLALPRKVVFLLWGGLVISQVGISPVLAGDCELKDAAALDGCKDKTVKATGPRVPMDKVPEYYALADPSFAGGEGTQDYMKIGDAQVILHLKGEVQCPDKIEVSGTLKQQELEKNKAWLIEVKEFKCVK
ncbi:secreted protein [Thioploca ingrica]|uniref:Secreted protein n=1 Tax=Thioploca ingrica TaxID=40754 RepID=A0A090ADY7_9GAMM|nr:secreted protein [Thioploca ingrica]